MMNIMMPAMSAYFTFIMPAAVGLYWMFKSILSTVKQIVIYKAMPLPVFSEEDYKAAERELMGKEKNKPVRRDPDAPRNPNVRSLHHIDDEDYESPAEREARLAARKRDYVEEDETPKQKTSDNAYSEGVTLKEDDRPARKDKKNKKDSED
jgi:YidC/Oxa1 family membrane protein insertase